MDIDQQIAATLGFPKLQYMAVERERRWLCREIPRELIVLTEVITDLYVTGARLRLREARPINGATPVFKLSRKADADLRTRLITTIYLPEEEFGILAASLQGARIKKVRHRLRPLSHATMSVDEFQGDLQGLILAEAEFETPDLLAAFQMPDFAVREVTDDPRYTGSYLARNGLPVSGGPQS
jgi:CYTH domain-containing protein